MSDSAQILAVRLVDEKGAAGSAAAVLAWLVERGVIEALPTDAGLGSRLAHRPGANALEVVSPAKPGVVDFRTLRTNGVEFEHGFRAMLLTAGDEMPLFRCPSCTQELDADDVLALVQDLANPLRPVPQIGCRACGARTIVCDLTVEGGAFANIALRFWNWWPLKDTFVRELGEKCGRRIHVLYDRL